MAATDIPPQIVVAFDFSECSELALQHALNLALEDGRRDFHFLVVLDPSRKADFNDGKKVDYDYAEEVQGLAASHIENAMKKLDRGGSISMMVHVRIGDPEETILFFAEEVGASLIICGSHGRTGLKRVVLGSVSESLVRNAKCPVTVARARGYADVERAKIVDTPDDQHGPKYIPPTRFHYDTGVPVRDKVWILY